MNKIIGMPGNGMIKKSGLSTGARLKNLEKTVHSLATTHNAMVGVVNTLTQENNVLQEVIKLLIAKTGISVESKITDHDQSNNGADNNPDS